MSDSASSILQINRGVNYLQLHSIARAEDGQSFDAHWDDMVQSENDPEFALKRRWVSRIEQRRAHDVGKPRPFEPTASTKYPATFAVYKTICRTLEDNEFTAWLQNPSALPLRPRDTTSLAALYRSPRSHVQMDLYDGRVLHQAERAFVQASCVQLPPFIDATLLKELAHHASVQAFRAMSHGRLGYDYSVHSGPLVALMHYLTTAPELLAWVERITACPPHGIDRLLCRAYKMTKSRDKDEWHDDIEATQKRMLAVNVCLHAVPCRGGELVLRRRERRWYGHPHVAKTRPARLGELTIFRLSRSLQHRVERVRSDAPRICFVGWYGAHESVDYNAWVGR